MLFNVIFFTHAVLFYALLYGFRIGVNATIYVTMISLGVTVNLLEWLRPRNPAYRPNRNDMARNVVFMVLEHALYRPLYILLMLNIVDPLMIAYPEISFLAPLWPRELPLFVQSVIAVFFMTLGSYWTHRWQHTVPAFWRFHRFHHIPRKLTWFISFWSHPLHFFFTAAGTILFPVLFAMPSEAILLTVVLTLIVGSENHGNYVTGRSPLNIIFPSIWEHEIHHSQKIPESNSNYGVGFLFWDHAFGTYTAPDPLRRIEAGVSEVPLDSSTPHWKMLLNEYLLAFRPSVKI